MPRNKCGSPGFCPKCYSGARGRGTFPGHYGFYRARSPSFREVLQEMKRTSRQSGDHVPGAACSDGSLASSHPLLFEHLTALKWDDGAPRETSTLMVLCELGRWKACLNDRAESRSAWVSADAFMALLDVLETGLRNDSIDWRARVQSRADKRR